HERPAQIDRARRGRRKRLETLDLLRSEVGAVFPRGALGGLEWHRIEVELDDAELSGLEREDARSRRRGLVREERSEEVGRLHAGPFDVARVGDRLVPLPSAEPPDQARTAETR